MSGSIHLLSHSSEYDLFSTELFLPPSQEIEFVQIGEEGYIPETNNCKWQDVRCTCKIYRPSAPHFAISHHAVQLGHFTSITNDVNSISVKLVTVLKYLRITQ